MAATQGTSGFGTLLKRGDGGVGAGVKASLTWGTTTASIRILAKVAGTAGNSKSVTVLSSGASFVKTTLTATVISITVPTTATVAMVIAWLYQDATFQANWDADYNAVGDGTGVCAARTVTSLSGGTAGAETFTTVAEVTNISGPDEALELIDATHMLSPGSRREFLPSLLDSGEVTFDVNFLPGDTNQEGLRTDMNSRTKRNFELVWTDAASTTYSFSGYVTKHSKTAKIDDKLSASVTVKITGDITKTP